VTAALADAEAARLGRVVDVRLVGAEHRHDSVRLEDRRVHLAEVGESLPARDRSPLGE
jgi:hypothetical protein